MREIKFDGNKYNQSARSFGDASEMTGHGVVVGWEDEEGAAVRVGGAYPGRSLTAVSARYVTVNSIGGERRQGTKPATITFCKKIRISRLIWAQNPPWGTVVFDTDLLKDCSTHI